MGFTTSALTEGLAGIVKDGAGVDKNKHLSLHTADPGTTGASEVTGGTYARKGTTWGTPASAQVDGSAQTFDVPAGTTITHWGVWSASSGGSFKYGGTLPASETFGSNGTYSLTPTMTASN